MINAVLAFIDKRFSKSLDFRIQIFNTLGVLGCALGVVLGVFTLFVHPEPLNVLANFSASAFAVYALVRANKTGDFQRYFLITVVFVFIILFPVLFFMGGGYKSGMPCFFVFAVVFTVIMLEGGYRAVFTILEIALYSGCLLTAYFLPDTVVPFLSEADMAKDIIVGCVISSVVLAFTIYRHIVLYDYKQKELNKANYALQGLNRMKTEFLSNVSHEMKTPLTVTSVNVQTVMDILEDMDGKTGCGEAVPLLHSAQNEIMRLSRMVDGMLTLASMSESTDKRRMDLSALLQSGVEALRLTLGKRGNAIATDIEPELIVFGNADLLSQVITNILKNAGTYTQNGMVTVIAYKAGGEITVAVRDTGTGITPELLPRVFERGVSTGGTGYGLFLSKAVVESHGGSIWIESGLPGGTPPMQGTTVYFTMPVYEGQSGGSTQ